MAQNFYLTGLVMAEEMGMTWSYKTPELHAVISPQLKTALQRLRGDRDTFLLLLVLTFRNVQNQEGSKFYPVTGFEADG